MHKKAERAREKLKNKLDSSSGERAPAPVRFGEVSGQLSLTFNVVSGKLNLTEWHFTESRSHASKSAKKASSGVAEPVNDSIFIRENKILQRLFLSQILYIQAMGDYVSIYTRDRKITIHQNLKALEGKLMPPKFIRVHRSFMVSLDKIEAIEESTVYINSNPIPIGEAYKAKLMKLLSIIR